jgi:quercetin dioxygenase-like cupin family protein
MEIVRFREADSWEPDGHQGVLNRLLAGVASGDVGAVSVWHGTLSPGGGADPHLHEGSVQIFYGLAGEVEMSGGGGDPVRLAVGDVAIVAAGETHDIRNRTDRDAEVLVVSAPALR